jgi:hypothetical protein
VGDHLETGRKGGEPPGGHGGTLALQDVKEEPCVPPEPRKKRKRVKKKVAKDPGAQLLAQAEQLRVAKMQEVRQKKKRKEKREGGEKARALVKALLGGQKKQKTSSRDGDPSSSPDGSRGDSSDEDKEESSSSSELLAPLQKRSSKRPGAVLKMLLHHAKTVETAEGDEVTTGVKMTSYFNLMVRPYYNALSRDMKELNLLAICLDELRAGGLGKLGDSLASRFLAIHTAVNEGIGRAPSTSSSIPSSPLKGHP